MRIAAVQMRCRPDRADNLERAGELVADAVADGAGLVVLPELFASLGSGRALRAHAEAADGPTVTWARDVATSLGVWFAPGSYVEQSADRFFNTAPLVSPQGEVVASYRKVHLFDVDVEGAGMHESDVFSAGDRPVVADVEGTTVGLTTCYDLRFPELWRAVALRGATVITLPSAFTAATGPAHWEPLLRARAIENQVFVVAPDQCGASPDGVARHGHSLVVDPWGTVLAEAGPDEERVLVVDLDATAVDRARRAVPSLANRRPSAYGDG